MQQASLARDKRLWNPTLVLKALTVRFSIHYLPYQTLFLALPEHTALTTTFPRLVSVTIVQRVSIAQKDPLNLLATAIKATSALEVNQLRHQREFSTLLHTQTVCPANVLLVIIALRELPTLFRALQAISKMSLEATSANPVLKACIVQLLA